MEMTGDFKFDKNMGRIRQSMNFEIQYASSLSNLLVNGQEVENRTGINTLSIQHQYFFLPNIATNFPIIKGKKVFPRLALIELMWILNGRSDVKWLNDRGVKYWDEWANNDLVKHPNIPLGSIGKSYGHQMRNFNGCDQLIEMVSEMASNPMSRRLKLNLWNPADLKETTLPPCVDYYHFGCIPQQNPNRENQKHNFYVDLHVVARSEDSFLGLPYDFISAGWMLTIICQIAETLSGNTYYFTPRHIHYTADDFHLYVNHIDQVHEYIGNVLDNKNNVINAQAVAQIGSRSFKSVDDFLKIAENNNYDNFWVNKFYDETYGKIKAEIAI